MKPISFLFYYSQLLLSVTLGFHQTANPLSLKWRWNFWQHRYESRHRTRHSINKKFGRKIIKLTREKVFSPLPFFLFFCLIRAELFQLTPV